MLEPEDEHDKLRHLADECLLKFDAYINSLPIPTDALTGSFYHIVTSLGRVSMANYVNLRLGFDDDSQDVLAWHCRNLLELNIFTKYVLRSKAEADEFAGHRLNDGLEIIEHLREYDLLLDSGLPSSAFDHSIAMYKKIMDAEGITPTAHLSTRRLARAVGMVKEYDAMNKVCSKLVHPTAWSILTNDDSAVRMPEAGRIFYGTGVKFFGEIFTLVRTHIRQHGMRHKA